MVLKKKKPYPVQSCLQYFSERHAKKCIHISPSFPLMFFNWYHMIWPLWRPHLDDLSSGQENNGFKSRIVKSWPVELSKTHHVSFIYYESINIINNSTFWKLQPLKFTFLDSDITHHIQAWNNYSIHNLEGLKQIKGRISFQLRRRYNCQKEQW